MLYPKVMALRWLLVWLMILLVVDAPVGFAQEPAGRKRPKIGLALSGGGARGIAHIGVLKWFDEHRIPVDYIAGTSMGGLVGGMYTMGLKPNEMRQLLSDINWNALLRGTPDYQELSFRRKEDRRQFQTDLELGGLRTGLQARSGLNPGHQIGLILGRITLPYATINNFDELPIPFRGVATDMLAARPVILKDGSLAQALRATMAIPGIFTPVERDGKVLADGGLVNNIPTDVVKDMGAEIVIAVDTGTKLGGRDALSSLFGMLTQSIAVMTIENDRRNLRLADILIAPDLGTYDLFDFASAEAIAELGYQGAAQRALVLERFALDEAAWQQHLAARQARTPKLVPLPTALAITGVDHEAAQDIHSQLDKYVGQPLKLAELEEDLTEIRGRGRYDRLTYELKRDNSQQELLIRAEKKPYGPPFVIPGVEIENAESSRIDFTLGARLTVFDLGSYGSELRTDVKLGSKTLLATEYYRRLGATKFFLAPRAYYERSAKDLFLNGSQVAEYRAKRFGTGMDVGYSLNATTELRLGYELSHLDAQVRIGDPILPALEGRVSNAAFRLTYDGQDSALVPTRGLRVQGQAAWFFDSPGAITQFPQAELKLSAFHPLTARSSVFAIGAGGTTFNRTAPPAQQFTLGGPFRLGAYGRDEFRGSHYFFAGTGYLRRISQLLPLVGRNIYAGGWYEFGSAFSQTSNAQYFHSVSGAVIVETRLGAISLGGSWGENGRGRLFFSLGRFF
jgi:NTE family protein